MAKAYQKCTTCKREECLTKKLVEEQGCMYHVSELEFLSYKRKQGKNETAPVREHYIKDIGWIYE